MVYSKKVLDENKNDLARSSLRDRRLHLQGSQGRREVVAGQEPELLGQGAAVHRHARVHPRAAWSDRGTAILSNQADVSWNVSKETFEEGRRSRTTIGTLMVAGGAGAYPDLLQLRQEASSTTRKVRRALHLGLSRQDLFEAFKTQEPLNYTRYMSHGSSLPRRPTRCSRCRATAPTRRKISTRRRNCSRRPGWLMA